MKKLGKILTLSLASLMLFACDDIVAEPKPVTDDKEIVTVDGNKDYYNNNFEVIFEKLTDSGTANDTIMKQLINIIAKEQVAKFYDLKVEEFENVLDNVLKTLAKKEPATLNGNAKVLEDIIIKEVKDKMIDKVRGGTYSTDYLFDEEKLVNELRLSLYNIEGDTFTKGLLVTPDSEYEEVFKADYADYIEKSIYPDVLKQLLTSVYLYENEYTSLGRSYARDVKYIKLDAISTHKDSVPVLINEYFKAFETKSDAFPTVSFDLDSLARIYKGVFNGSNLSEQDIKERDFAKDAITTREEVLDEELEKVCVDPKNNNFAILTDETKRDNDLVSSYTGSYKYPVQHGKELKDRELATMDIVVDDGLAVRSGGVSDLPIDMRNRLFSSGIEANLETLTMAGTENSIKVLTPKLTLNQEGDDYVNKYAYFDSSSNAYYIVIVDDYFNTTKLRDGKKDSENLNEEAKANALEIARLLSTTSSNQKDALIHYLQLDEYKLEFGDQSFYDYIESTYPELLEDE